MARPIVNNISAAQIGYTVTSRPAVRINLDLYDEDIGQIVDVTKFQYVSESNLQDYVASNETYLSNWNINASQDNLYVKLSRQGSSTSYIIQIYADASQTLLVATGAGETGTSLTLSENESSGISGSVFKTTTNLSEGTSTIITLANNTVWNDAIIVTGTTVLSNLPTSSQSPGRSTTFYWDIENDLGESINENYCFRLQVRETETPNNESYMKKTSLFSIVLQTPVASISLAAYTNQRTYQFNVSITGTATLYRTAESATALASKAWSNIATGNLISVYFATATQENKTIYVEISDSYFNRSEVISDTINYHTDAPGDLYINLVGSSGSSTYTGVVIDDDGVMTPSDEVTVEMYATDLTAIEMYIDGDIKDGANVRTWLTFDPTSASEVVRLEGTFIGNDTSNQIGITFKDLAGNTSVIAETIRYNSKIYDMTYKNLRLPTSLYDHQVMETTSAGNNVVISKSEDVSDEYVRKWDDIFYPLTHQYPVNPDGSIDETAAIALNGTSTDEYGAVSISNGAIVYDSEDRVTNVDWVKDGTKDYEDLESSYEQGLQYWIIDNSGYGTFTLQFEHFYLNSDSYGPPYNNMSPYDGDCLVIYDASAAGCVQELTGAYGKTEYTLLDASKLVELQAYTGEGSSVYSLTTGRSMSATTNGAFTTSEISTTSLICLVLYTDAAITASGFKLKAGEKHELVWYNYDIDEENGQIWIHKYPLGNAPTSEVRAIYDYYDLKVTTDYENGQVTFETDPSGEITADYTYYDYGADERPQSRTFAMDNDDFVDYLDVSVYVDPDGIDPDKTLLYVFDYPDATQEEGKVTQNFTVDKDRGILEFVNASGEYGDEFAFIPKGRLFADYQYHTYLRLSNDGYGNFTFTDETLVADDTPQYPDYTFGDIKFVNEGDAILEDGCIRFLPRGYDNDGDYVIDEVLDINRPWDVQEGSKAETYDLCACEIKSSYTWDATCTKTEARTILSNWKDQAFGFDCYPEQIWYGRIVWVLGGTGGSSYPTTTTGRKTWSSDIEGKYYNIET